MLNLLCVCVNGMGTSPIIKINVSNICMEIGVDAVVECSSMGEAGASLGFTDIVVTSPEIASMLPPSKAVIVEAQNLVSHDLVKEALVKAIKEHFPNEIA
jgi:PTS system ascorbate-specific IIB component